MDNLGREQCRAPARTRHTPGHERCTPQAHEPHHQMRHTSGRHRHDPHAKMIPAMMCAVVTSVVYLCVAPAEATHPRLTGAGV
jgi:hypothetical protein